MNTVATAEWTALGTYVELAVTCDAALPSAEAMLRAALDDLDVACSRFRPDSELSGVNAAAGRPAPAGALLRAAVRAAVGAAAATQGLVDPTLGAELVAAGYDRDFAKLAAPVNAAEEACQCEPAERSRRQSYWRYIDVDDQEGTITVPSACRLDLGATGKAFGADLAAATIASRLGVGVLVSLGGDVATAGAAPAGGWGVRTGSTSARDEDAETVLLDRGGIATSSPVVRRWQRGHRHMHHILDPRSGQPVRLVWRSVSVVAPTCVEANTLTTAAVVVGEDAPDLLRTSGCPARLVATDGRTLRVGGWPDPTEWSR